MIGNIKTIPLVAVLAHTFGSKYVYQLGYLAEDRYHFHIVLHTCVYFE